MEPTKKKGEPVGPRFIPEIWSTRMLIKIYDHLAGFMNWITDYEGEIGRLGDSILMHYTENNTRKKTPLTIDRQLIISTPRVDVMEIQSDRRLMDAIAEDLSKEVCAYFNPTPSNIIRLSGVRIRDLKEKGMPEQQIAEDLEKFIQDIVSFPFKEKIFFALQVASPCMYLDLDSFNNNVVFQILYGWKRFSGVERSL